jgi:hypothetical protein
VPRISRLSLLEVQKISSSAAPLLAKDPIAKQAKKQRRDA